MVLLPVVEVALVGIVAAEMTEKFKQSA